MLLTVGGFAIAGIQLYRVKKSSQAATDALDVARKDVMRGQLAALSLHLSSVSHDLSFAMQSNNAAVAHRALLRYAGIAEEIIPLLTQGLPPHLDLAERFSNSAGEALNVKERLMVQKEPDTVRLVKKIDTEIGRLAKDVTGVMASDRYNIGGSAHV